MADTAQGTMADIQALLAQRGVSPNSAENLNRAMLMLRGGPDQGFIDDRLDAYADGVSASTPRVRSQPGTPQRSTRTPQPTPVSQDTAGGGGGTGRGATAGTAATTATPATAVTEPTVTVPDPAAMMNLTGENGEQTARAPSPTSEAVFNGEATPELLAHLQSVDQPLPFTMSPADYVAGGVAGGGAALARNIAPSLLGSLARANVRPGGQSPVPTTGQPYGPPAPPVTPNPWATPVASRGSVPNAGGPLPNPAAGNTAPPAPTNPWAPAPTAPPRPVAPDLPRTGGPNSPSVEVVPATLPRPQAAPARQEVSPEAVTGVLRELLARPRTPPTTPTPAPRYQPTVPPVNPNPGPPRAGPDAATQFAGMPRAVAPPRPPAQPARSPARGKDRARRGMRSNRDND